MILNSTLNVLLLRRCKIHNIALPQRMKDHLDDTVEIAESIRNVNRIVAKHELQEHSEGVDANTDSFPFFFKF